VTFKKKTVTESSLDDAKKEHKAVKKEAKKEADKNQDGDK